MLSMRRMGNAWGKVFSATRTVSACNVVIYKKYIYIQMTDIYQIYLVFIHHFWLKAL